MPPRKRQAPSPSTPDAPSGRRRSTRIGSSGKKSQYFEANTDDSESDVETSRQAKRAKTSASRGRGRPAAGKSKRNGDLEDEDDDDDAYDVDEEEDQEQDDEGDDEEYDEDGDTDEGAGKRGKVNGTSVSRGSIAKTTPAKKKTAKLDDDDDEDDDDNRAMKVTFIPNVEMRPLDGVEYQDDRLHKNTLFFLKDLRANNKRPWLKSNDDEFRRSLQDWKTYVETITQRIITADETVPELPTKDIIFRIYRDIRFSKDPTPYKAHYSAAWSRTGKKGPYACYYIHCEPGNKSFVGGGLWHPEKAFVDALRMSIDERPRKWRQALGQEPFRKTFLPKAKAGDGEAAVKAFTQGNQSNALKKKPQDYSADHRDIELLKLRNYTVMKKLPDSIFTDVDGQEQMAEIISAMVPFITFLNKIIMPDPDASDSESDEEEDEE